MATAASQAGGLHDYIIITVMFVFLNITLVWSVGFHERPSQDPFDSNLPDTFETGHVLTVAPWLAVSTSCDILPHLLLLLLQS